MDGAGKGMMRICHLGASSAMCATFNGRWRSIVAYSDLHHRVSLSAAVPAYRTDSGRNHHELLVLEEGMLRGL